MASQEVSTVLIPALSCGYYATNASGFAAGCHGLQGSACVGAARFETVPVGKERRFS